MSSEEKKQVSDASTHDSNADIGDADQVYTERKVPLGAEKEVHIVPYEGNLHVNDRNVPTYAGLSGQKLILALTATCTCGFLLFGYDQGVMAAIINGKVFTHDFPANLAVTRDDPIYQGPNAPTYGGPDDPWLGRHNTSHARIMQAFYTAIYEVGCFFGAVFSLFFGNYLGRIRTIQLGAIVMCVGVVLQVAAIPGYWAGGQFLIGRTITGIGNGMNTATIPTWQSEVSPSKDRGLHVCIEASMIATGTAISYWLDFGLHFINSSFNWRFPIAFQVVFAFVLLGGTLFLPESPRYLMTKKHYAEARRVVAAINDAPYDDPKTHAAYTVMELANNLVKTEGRIKKREMLKGGPVQPFRRAVIGSLSQVYQQVTGCNAVIYFLPLIFTDYIGLSENVALICSGVSMTLYAAAAYSSYFFIERLGRRLMFLIGYTGQMVGMIIAFSCMVNEPTDTPDPDRNNKSKNALKGTVFGLFWFMIFFGATILELPWLYPAEINPLRTRTNANAMSTISNWSFNFAVVMWTPPMIQSIGWGTFLFFAAINATGIPLTYFFYPETAGRSLEEIDLIFATGYFEKKWYVAVANELPHLSNEETTQRTDELYSRFNYHDGDVDEEAPAPKESSAAEDAA